MGIKERFREFFRQDNNAEITSGAPQQLRLLNQKQDCAIRIKDAIENMLLEIKIVAGYVGSPENPHELTQVVLLEPKMRGILNDFTSSMRIYKRQFSQLLQKIEDVELVFSRVIDLMDERIKGIKRGKNRQEFLSELGKYQHVLQEMLKQK